MTDTTHTSQTTTRRQFMAVSGVAILASAATTLPAYAGKDQIYSDWRGRAIKGYDPVAYFTESKPVEGSSDITYEWNGATWRFASTENRDMFAQNPEKYAPQYGGYCAYAVAKGATASIDPDAWSIVDGKLYLNYNKSTQDVWESDRDAYIEQADDNWPKVLE